MHVAHITSHFASFDYTEVIRDRAIRFLFATRVSHRCHKPRFDIVDDAKKEPHRR